MCATCSMRSPCARRSWRTAPGACQEDVQFRHRTGPDRVEPLPHGQAALPGTAAPAVLNEDEIRRVWNALAPEHPPHRALFASGCSRRSAAGKCKERRGPRSIWVSSVVDDSPRAKQERTGASRGPFATGYSYPRVLKSLKADVREGCNLGVPEYAQDGTAHQPRPKSDRADRRTVGSRVPWPRPPADRRQPDGRRRAFQDWWYRRF